MIFTVQFSVGTMEIPRGPTVSPFPNTSDIFGTLLETCNSFLSYGDTTSRARRLTSCSPLSAFPIRPRVAPSSLPPKPVLSRYSMKEACATGYRSLCTSLINLSAPLRKGNMNTHVHSRVEVCFAYRLNSIARQVGIIGKIIPSLK